MYAIKVTVQLVDDATGEVATSRWGGTPVEHSTRFYPLFAKSQDGEGPVHTLYEAICKVMHLGTAFYRVGGTQKNL